MGLEVLGARWQPKVRAALAALDAAVLDDGDALEQLTKFLDLIATWNQRTDLTAARSTDELVDLVVADAAVLAREETRRSGVPAEHAWLDVGSGMGAPGIPLALFLPRCRMLLVEPRQKRVAFLRTVQGSLDLARLRVERKRSDALRPLCADIAVSRATLAPQAWLSEGARLARAVWVLLATEPAPELRGWNAECAVSYRWPLTGYERRAVRYVATADITQ